MSRPNFIAFAALKGGTGKTTISWNIASILAKRGKKLLIIDIDPQGNMSNNFNFDIFDQGNATIGDLLTRFDENTYEPKYKLEQLINVAPNPKMPEIDVVVSKCDDYFANTDLITRGTAHNAFAKAMERNKNVLENYDYVIIDVGANLSALAFSVLVYTDRVIMVTDPSVNGVKGCEYFPKMYKRQLKMWEMDMDDEKFDTIIINDVENRNAVSASIDYLYETNGAKCLKSQIPHSTRFRESDIEGTPIIHLEVKSRANESKEKIVAALDNLTDELIERGVF